MAVNTCMTFHTMFHRHHEHLNREKYTICLTAQSFMDYIGWILVKVPCAQSIIDAKRVLGWPIGWGFSMGDL